MAASSEFIALCRSQVAILTQGLGASLSAIYLTEELVEGENAKLVPVVVYPEAAVVWEPEEKGVVDRSSNSPVPLFPSASLPLSASISDPEGKLSAASGLSQANWSENSLKQQRQIVLPLIHEGVVMGLLVTGRDDRGWNEREQVAIEGIAHTLAIAGIMDRQRVWFEQQLVQQRRLDSQQRDLLDNLLHQFRNPLTALRTFSKLLLRRLLPEDTNREVASSIVRETERLQELLQHFDIAIDINTAEIPLNLRQVQQLDLSSDYPSAPLLPYTTEFEQAPIQLFSVIEVLEPLLDSARAIAQERNLDLIAKIKPKLPQIKANRQALREVLSNLIDNALKYTPAGGQLLIQTGLEKDLPPKHYQGIAISDTGVGIPPEDLEHIFERHYRGVQTETGIPGTGLGLAIARDLVQQMQGEIQVISPANYNWATNYSLPSQQFQSGRTTGKGVTFIVWLLRAE